MVGTKRGLEEMQWLSSPRIFVWLISFRNGWVICLLCRFIVFWSQLCIGPIIVIVYNKTLVTMLKGCVCNGSWNTSCFTEHFTLLSNRAIIFRTEAKRSAFIEFESLIWLYSYYLTDKWYYIKCNTMSNTQHYHHCTIDYIDSITVTESIQSMTARRVCAVCSSFIRFLHCMKDCKVNGTNRLKVFDTMHKTQRPANLASMHGCQQLNCACSKLYNRINWVPFTRALTWLSLYCIVLNCSTDL